MRQIYGKDNTTGCASGKQRHAKFCRRAARGSGGLGVVWTVAAAYAGATAGFFRDAEVRRENRRHSYPEMRFATPAQ
jgi:hypothetical protein